MSQASLPAGYELRGARPDEIPSVATFAESVFAMSHEYFLARYRNYPGAKAEHSRLVLRDGRYVSHQRLYGHKLSFAGSFVRAWAIGDVCTAADCRRKGLGFALLDDCMAYARADGAALVLIRAGLHEFYCQAGWEIMPLPGCRVSVPEFPADALQSEGYLTRTYEPERDRWQVAEIHHTYNAGRSLVRQRDGYFWEKLDLWCPWQQGLGFMVAERDGAVVAYGRMWDNSLGELCHLPGHEPAAVAVFGAFQRLARMRRDENMRVTIPADHTLWAILTGRPGVEPRTGHSTLLRLVSLRALFEQTLDGLSARLRASSRDLSGPLTIRCLGESVFLEPRAGHLALGRSCSCGRVVELTQQQLLHLGAGLAQARELLGGAECEDVVADLDALFPPGNPIYWNADSV